MQLTESVSVFDFSKNQHCLDSFGEPSPLCRGEVYSQARPQLDGLSSYQDCRNFWYGTISGVGWFWRDRSFPNRQKQTCVREIRGSSTRVIDFQDDKRRSAWFEILHGNVLQIDISSLGYLQSLPSENKLIASETNTFAHVASLLSENPESSTADANIDSRECDIEQSQQSYYPFWTYFVQVHLLPRFVPLRRALIGLLMFFAGLGFTMCGTGKLLDDAGRRMAWAIIVCGFVLTVTGGLLAIFGTILPL